MDKRLKRKICKICGTPADFCFEYIEDVSLESDIRRMKEYIRCSNRVIREYNKAKEARKNK